MSPTAITENGIQKRTHEKAFSNSNDDLELPSKRPKGDGETKVVSKDSALSLDFVTSSSSGGSGSNGSDETDSLSPDTPDILKRQRLGTVTISSDSESESDVEFVEEKKVAVCEKTQASSLPFQLNLQVVCLLGTGGYGKVFLVKTKDDLSKQHLLTMDSNSHPGVNLSPDQGKKRAARGRPRKIQFIRNVGKGAQNPSPDFMDGFHYYAMKTVKKVAVCKSKADTEHIRTEQRVLSKVKHPFIVDCHLTLQTRRQLLFISEFIQGGELFNLLDKFAPLPEKDARFYMCEILMALDYLHCQRIIYRDLKPENIMLCKDGHLKLIDFGLCRDNFPASPTGGRVSTATKCGTKEYMAPEVYKKEQYGFTADWWSYGAVAFDLMTNNVPVSNQEYDKDVRYPHSMSRAAVNLISKLLDVDKRKRLGSHLGARCVSKHEFFLGVDWEMVKTKGLKPPYILSGSPLPGDHSCFSRKVTNEDCRVCSGSDNQELPDFNSSDPFCNFDYVAGNQLDEM